MVIFDRLCAATGVERYFLLKNATERLGGGRPGALLLLEAELVERGLDGDHDVALERVLGRGDVHGVALGEGGIAVGGDVGDLHELGGERVGGDVGSGVLADGHCSRKKVEKGVCGGFRGSFNLRRLDRGLCGGAAQLQLCDCVRWTHVSDEYDGKPSALLCANTVEIANERDNCCG